MTSIRGMVAPRTSKGSPSSTSAGKKRGAGPGGNSMGERRIGFSWNPNSSRNETPMAVMREVRRARLRRGR